MAKIPSNKRQICVAIDGSVVDKLQAIARKERRAFNTQVQIILEKGLEVIVVEQGHGNAHGT